MIDKNEQNSLVIYNSPHMSKKCEKRQAIMQAAVKIFSNNSFQNSKISEIAKRANVAEGTIYQYFKNKEDLFFSIPAEETKRFCKELELHLQGITGALNKIRKYVWYFIFFFETNPDYGRIVMLEMRVSKGFIKTKTYNTFKKSTRIILEIIKEGQKEDVIRKDINMYLIRQLIQGILEHVITRWLLKGQKYKLMELHENISDLVINGIVGSKN